MWKRTIFLFLVPVCTVLALCLVLTACATAADDQENAYVRLGVTAAADDDLSFAFGAGYEGALTDFLSLGAYAGMNLNENFFGADLLLNARYYIFNTALESLFVGANLGLAVSMYEGFNSNPYGNDYDYGIETNTDFVLGLNLGYKFIFDDGFSVEPSIGYDFLPGRFNAGVSLGYVWGGRAVRPAPAPAPAPAPRPAPAPAAAPRRAETGLYLGIIGFNETLTRREIAILNSGNKSQFQGFVRDLRIGPSTALYHAVDNAVTMLEAANLPDDLVSVSIITFTDGSDTISLERDSRYNSQDEFRRAIQTRISSTTIKNLAINAYSIGIQGADVIDRQAFMAGLEALATSSSNVYFAENRNMNEVNRYFGQIARSLYNESQLQTIRLRMPGGFDDGTRIRFTFDNVNAATVANSNLYIEGTYRRSDRSLQNVVYGGFNPRGTTVSGSLAGGYVTYNFENVTTVTGNPVVMQNAQQWNYVPSMSLWQRNSEFNPNSDSQTIVERKSAVILLVLDCTTSLTAGGANGFAEMKEAAVNFLNILTN